MDLFYWKSARGNFGDDLNLWLWDALIPGWRDWRDDTVLLGVGTILSDKQAYPPGRRRLVLGSGWGYGGVPDLTDPALWDFRAVRGPQTVAALGLPPDRAAVDPAMMIPDLPEFRGFSRGADVLFVPHHSSAEVYDWPRLCAAAGLTYLDPRGEAKAVIRTIAEARRVVTEAMHGAILADAFRVPWVAVEVTRGFHRAKWGDWGEAIGLVPEIDRMFPAILTETGRTLRQGLARLKGRPGSSPARRPAAPGQGSVAPAPGQAPTPAQMRSGHGPDRKPLQPVLDALAVRKLRRLAAREGQLSDTARLEAAKARLRAILQETARDYAG